MQGNGNPMLICPVGCAFLLTIAQDGAPLEVAMTPPQAFARAAAALRNLNPWSTNFTQNVSRALSYRPILVDLAQQVLAHPASHWWTTPMDKACQMLLVDSDRSPMGGNPEAPDKVTRWEAYAERPTGWKLTSTLHTGHSCLDTMIESGVGEWSLHTSAQRFTSHVKSTVRVMELVRVEDWHALCANYPTTIDDTASPSGGGTLTPDWRHVATHWDGIHLTFMGLLTIPFVRYTSEAGSTMLWSWDTEGTLWLRGDSATVGEPLPPVSTQMSAPHIVAPLAFEA